MERASKWTRTKLFLVITSVFQCNAVSWWEQLQHIADTQAESQGIPNDLVPSRRRFFNSYDPRELTSIIGSPSMPSHLPEAEPILPGHTLIKPALGMLKSSVKFPHRELEDGSGVYGNYDTLGIRYGLRNERVLYSGFRRMPANGIIIYPEPELRPNNKIFLHQNDNKAKLSKKRTGQIYLKRIYVSKQPVSVRSNGLSTRRFIFIDADKLKHTIGNIKQKAVDVGEFINFLWKDFKASKTNKTMNNTKTKLRLNDKNTDSKIHGASKFDVTIFNYQNTDKKIPVWDYQNTYTYNHVATDESARNHKDIFRHKKNNKKQSSFFNNEDSERRQQYL